MEGSQRKAESASCQPLHPSEAHKVVVCSHQTPASSAFQCGLNISDSPENPRLQARIGIAKRTIMDKVATGLSAFPANHHVGIRDPVMQIFVTHTAILFLFPSRES